MSSRTKTALVIGIAAAGLFLALFAILSFNWHSPNATTNVSSEIQPLQSAANEKLLYETKELPEVKSFLSKYPNATSEVDSDYSYIRPEAGINLNIKNFTIERAIIKYTYQQNNEQRLYQLQSNLFVYMQKSPASEITMTDGVYPMKQFDDYYYAVRHECVASKIGSYTKGIAGFPDGTYMAYLSKDCAEVENQIQ